MGWEPLPGRGWRDYRSGLSWDIYGARVSPDGAVLDPDGIAICAAANAQWSPAVAWNGSQFLVVWRDFGWKSEIDRCRVEYSIRSGVLATSAARIETPEVRAEVSAAALAQSGVNLGDVMERVACAFRTGAKGEALAAEGRTYRAVYERNRVVFSPFLPGSRMSRKEFTKSRSRRGLRKGAGPSPTRPRCPVPIRTRSRGSTPYA